MEVENLPVLSDLTQLEVENYPVVSDLTQMEIANFPAVSGLMQLEVENLPVASVNAQQLTGVILLTHYSIINVYFIKLYVFVKFCF
jgi:hypothetical protein